MDVQFDDQNEWGLVDYGYQIIKTAIPLQRSSYSILLCDGVAEVSCVQQYRNSSNEFLQTQFRLPINPKSCLHKFAATFGNKKIQGVIKQRQEAIKEYTTALNEGRVIAYGQKTQEDFDVMTILIGNIDPGMIVTIQLTYIEELKLCLNTFYRFDLLTKTCPKYPPQMHQGFQNVEQQSLSAMRGHFQSSFSLKVRGTRKIVAYRSTTHPLQLIHQNDAGTSLEFQLEKDKINRDFCFIYTTDNFQLPSFVIGQNDINTTVMVSFIPKFCQMSLKDAEKAAINDEHFDVELDAVRSEYIFLLDRSGSMEGDRIEDAKRALILFLKSLPVDSYFNVMSFGSRSEFMFQYSVRLGNETIQDALERIQLMSADMGGTEILRPLQTILSAQMVEGYPRQIFLLTDGEIQNTNSVIQLVNKNAKKSRIHAIGIGEGASRYLIENGRGMSIMIKDSENPASKIIQLLKQTLSPAITQVSLQVETDLVQSIVPNPESIPFILKGQIVNFFITFKKHLEQPTRISFSYRNPCSNIPYKAEANIQPKAEYFSSIDKMAHFRLIKVLEDLENKDSDIRDSIYLAKPIKPKTALVDLSLKHQILSKYTSFISTEKQLIDGRYQEVRDKGKVRFNIELDLKYAQLHKEVRSTARFSPKGFSIASTNLRNYMSTISHSAVGKGAFAGKGKVGTCRSAQKRHARSSISGITKPDIRRLARKGGVQRVSSFIYDDTRQILKDFLEQLLKRSITFCEYSRRKTVSALDIVQALKTIKRPLYISPSPPKSAPKAINLNNTNNQKVEPKDHCNFIPNAPNIYKNEPNNVRIRRDQDLINEITKHKKIEGYWDNLDLIKKIVDTQIIDEVHNQAQMAVIVTILILGWLLKYCPDPQYVLIIKKTQRWLQKQPNYECYDRKYSQFVK